MGNILDYEEMLDILNSFKNIKKVDDIGFSYYNLPICHYSYGHGKYHAIIVAGVHSSELISNVFVLRFMEKLDKEKFIDEDKFTLHFIPIFNPEGTLIVSSTIRSLLPRGASLKAENLLCTCFYTNCKIDREHALKYGRDNHKLIHEMFRYADLKDLPSDLRDNVFKLLKDNDLSKGALISWSNNGRGVDLNANLKDSDFIQRVKSGEVIYNDLHLNDLRRDVLGPLGCPYFKYGEIEKENIALLNFYKSIYENYDFIGSFIYHSCGGIVYYLNEPLVKNPWNSDINFEKNKLVALKYGTYSGYKLEGIDYYTTVDSMIKSLFPVTLLIELGSVTGNPLSQFIDNEDFNFAYSNTISKNTEALCKTLDYMCEIYDKI